jgi:hypothetical protein
MCALIESSVWDVSNRDIGRGSEAHLTNDLSAKREKAFHAGSSGRSL